MVTIIIKRAFELPYNDELIVVDRLKVEHHRSCSMCRVPTRVAAVDQQEEIFFFVRRQFQTAPPSSPSPLHAPTPPRFLT